MNIWLLQTGEPLPLNDSVRKLRTGLLADELVERGHNVIWWVSAFEHQQKKWVFSSENEFEISKGFILKILYGCGYKKNISLARYLDHRIVSSKFRKEAAAMDRPDVIIASMPCHHLAYEVVKYSKCNSIPIIVDVRDLWPDIFINKIPGSTLKMLGKILLSTDFARSRYLLLNADAILAVSEGYLKWALKYARRDQSKLDRVIFLGYKKNNSCYGSIPEWLKLCKDKKIVLYIGTFGASYELSLIIETARRFDKIGRSDVYFIIAGAGEQLEILKKKSGGLKNVLLPGWIGKKEIDAVLQNAFIGIVPCISADNTVPNKPFEYISAGLPILSSLEGDMATIIERYRIGYNYKVGDIEALYNNILMLVDSPNLYNEFSQNALRFFEAYGNADKIYSDYADHIEMLVREKGPTNNMRLK
jgi:glycosyltransferase involved in cell wall biosynthesis